jgi:small subunit ribosomal protein S6
MRRYETLFIVTPDSSEEDLKAVASKFQAVVADMNGIVTSYEEQGSKRLAYTVKKQNKGYYVLMNYVGLPELVAEIERNMRLDDRVLKYLTVKLAEEVDPESTEIEETKVPEEKEPTDVSEEQYHQSPQEQISEGEEFAEE